MKTEEELSRHTMPSTKQPALKPSIPSTGRRAPRPAGWRIVAQKELSDHLRSARFAVLLVLIALAGLAAANSAASGLRRAAASASESESVFLMLYTISPERIPSVVALIGFLGPLLGIGFGFDAVSSERSSGTLARLVSQPIHRDDVITGKFAAGLALIALAITTLVALIAGFGIMLLGVTPGFAELVRLIVFIAVAVAYVGVWLAFAVLVSVVSRRAATSVLACLGLWIVLTLFAGLITGAVAGVLAPVGSDPTVQEVIDNARTERALSRISPERLHNEAVTVVLDPTARATGVLTVRQLDRAIPDTLPLDQSLLLVAPHVTTLVATTVVLFAVAFIAFMRQEVRA